MKSYDVAIIGGGLIGGAIAWELARHGLQVVLFDRQQPGREASWAAAGILSASPESPAAIPLVPLFKASLALYPEFVAAAEEVTGRSVGFRRESAIEAFFAGDARRELSTFIALNHGLGLAAEPLPVEEARELEPALSEDAHAAALLPDEASVDNRLLTEAVLAAAARAGTEIRAGATVERVMRSGNRVAGVVAGSEKVAATQVVLAAGCFSAQIADLARYAPTRPVRGQLVALRSERVNLRRVLRSEHGYLVPRDAGRLVAGSTTENVGYEKGVTAGGVEQILHAALEIAPGVAGAAIVETWSGLRPGTPDHLPILGPTDVEGLLIATGHYRNGILLAPTYTGSLAGFVFEELQLTR
jgi:glycine oxidase